MVVAVHFRLVDPPSIIFESNALITIMLRIRNGRAREVQRGQ